MTDRLATIGPDDVEPILARCSAAVSKLFDEAIAELDQKLTADGIEGTERAARLESYRVRLEGNRIHGLAQLRRQLTVCVAENARQAPSQVVH